MAAHPSDPFHEYGRLEKRICEIEAESVQARKEALEANYREVKKHLKEEKDRARQLEGELEKQKKKEKKLNRPGVTRFKARIGAEGLEKEKELASDKVSEIVAQSKGAEEVISVLKDQEASLKQEIKNLSSRGDELNSLKAVQEDILVNVFGGVAGDAEENAIEREVDVLAHKKEKIAFAKTKYESAETHLKAAAHQLQNGLRILNMALGCNTIDIIGNRPGLGRGHTPLMNIAQANQMQQCKQCLAEAQLNLTQAKKYVPNLPRITEADIQGMNVLGMLIFDNIFTDLYQRQKILKNMEQMNGTLESVKYAIRWIADVIKKINKDLEKEEKLYYDARRRLSEKRHALMRKILVNPPASQAPPTFQVPPVVQVGPAFVVPPVQIFADPSAPNPNAQYIYVPVPPPQRSYSLTGGWSVNVGAHENGEKEYDPLHGEVAVIPDDKELYGE